MATQGAGRVFVGVNGSLPSLRALREAAAAARCRHAPLHVIYVRQPEQRPVVPPMAGLFGPIPPSCWDPQHPEWVEAAGEDLIRRCLLDALGGEPADLDVHHRVLVGYPATALAGVGCRDDDLLVLGTDGGRRWHHPRRGSVSKYCVRHSRCPVLVTPRTEFARTARHRVWLRRRIVPHDPWKEFDATVHREPHPIG